MCIASCGRAVCRCQRCEQSAPWWRWGYGMGRHRLQTIKLHFINGNLNAQRYSGKILRPIVVPFIHRHHLMFQHDNAWPYVIRICTQLLESENVPVLAWPAYSCHPLSMFGMLWINVCDSVFQFPPISSNFTQPLKRSGTTFNSLINSMWRRCVVLHEANGGHTRFWLVFWSTP